MRQEEYLQIVSSELDWARARFPAFNSPHEGYAVIQEELDELWEAVKHNDPFNAQKEAIQVAAMAVRFLVDRPHDQDPVGEAGAPTPPTAAEEGHTAPSPGHQPSAPAGAGMTGPLEREFAQLWGTLDFLREIENGTRCGTCQRPPATAEDWQRYDEGEGEHLCWETVCSQEPEPPTALERLTESRAALSSIERHVQDMEKALEWGRKQADIEDKNESRAKAAGDHSGVVAHGYCANQFRMMLAALPAREKGTE